MRYLWYLIVFILPLMLNAVILFAVPSNSYATDKTEYLKRGNEYYNKGYYDQAIADFSKALEINPNYAVAYYSRARAYHSKGDYNRAVADYKKAKEIDSSYTNTYFENLSKGYAKKGENNYTDGSNENADILYTNQGNAYTSKGDYDRAIAEYGKAIEANPRYGKAYYNRGNAYVSKGDYDRAINDFSKAIEINPRNADIYYRRGIAYNWKGQYDSAISDLNKVIEINPGNAEAYYSRGYAYNGKGQHDHAITNYSKAVELNSGYAYAYYGRGVAYYSKGEYDRAISDYNRTIELSPKFAQAYNNRGLAYWNKGEYERAISDYDKALEINPKVANAHKNRELAYAEKYKRDHALSQQKNAEDYNQSGNSYYNNGNYDQAIADYSRAIEIDPSYDYAYRNRGLAYRNKGWYDQAISDYNKAIEINPRYADAYNDRGIAYDDKGYYDQAIADFSKALEINPKVANAHKNRELAYAERAENAERERFVFLTTILCSSIPLTIGLGVGLFFILRKKAKYCQKYLEKAKSAFANKDYDLSQKLYEKIIKILALKESSSLSASLKKILGEAYLGLGRIYEKKKNPSSAANFYDKALNSDISVSSLPDTAIILLGNMYADDTDRSRIAVEVYIKFILLEPMSKDTEKVYSILEGLCRIDENLDADARGHAMKLNKKVVESNPDVEWAHFYLGVGSFLNNDLSNAQKYLSHAITQNPKRALSYYWLGNTHLGFNKIYDAATQFYTFIKYIPPDKETTKQGEAYFSIGKSLIHLLGGVYSEIDPAIDGNAGKLEKALNYFELAAAKDSSKAGYFFNTAQVLSLLKRTDEAINAYKKAIELDNKNSEYFYLLAKELKKAGNYEEAKERVIAAIGISDRVEYRKLLAELYFITRKFKDAEDECRRVFEAIKDFDLETLCVLIPALYHQSKYGDVIDTCEKYSQIIKNAKATYDTVFCVARSYSKLSKFEEAIGWYKQLLEKEERTDARYYLGCALSHKERFDEAVETFHKVVGNGNHYDVLASLQCGHVFSRMGKIKEAEESYQRAYSIEPGNVDVLYALGSFYYDIGDDEKALYYLTEVIKSNPEHAHSHFTLGLIHEKKGNVEQAIAGYEKALTDETTSLKGHLRLGIMYCRQSEYEKAIQHLQKVYQSGDRSDNVLFYLGLAGSHNGQDGMVLEAWNELRKRHPDDSHLESNIYKYHYITGCRWVEENKYQEAIPEWEEYLKKHIEDTKTKQNLAELHFRSCISEMNNGDINKAKNHILRAVALDGNSENYLLYSGLCDFKMENYTGCIALFNKLLERQPDNTRIKYHLGLSLLKNSEKEKAMKIFDDLSKRERRDVYSNYAASIIANEYIKEGKHSEGARILASLV